MQIKTVPFWTDISRAPEMYPWLDHHESCEVAIVGSGIAGVLCALTFAKAGVRTILCGDQPVGTGSTAASPGVISYQLEGGIEGLSAKIGAQKAGAFYKLCADTVTELVTLCGELGEDVGLRPAQCLYYTTSPGAQQRLFDEYLSRSQIGLDVEFLESDTAAGKFSFPLAGGILSKNLAAEVDPYLLTCALAKKAQDLGAQIYENTRIVCMDETDSGVTLHTQLGKTIKAEKVIMAAGSESARQLGLYADIRTAFNLVTAPLESFPGWDERTLLASDGLPDLRLRTTPDNRIFISGLSAGLSLFSRMPGMRPLDALKRKKYQDLLNILREMFPGLYHLEPEYTFASDFIRTSDALPVVGVSDCPCVLFCLCTGENGILFAAMAAKMLLEYCQGSPPAEMCLFSPNR